MMYSASLGSLVFITKRFFNLEDIGTGQVL